MKGFLRVELRGGLGNQLFQYYAGAYLAHIYEKRLQVDQTHLYFNHERHVTESVKPENNFLLKLSLPGEILVRTGTSFWFEKVIRKVFDKTGYFTNNLLTPNIFFNSYDSKEIGYDEKLELGHFNRIAGYFQTYRYYDELTKNNSSYIPKLKNASKWFEEMSKNIDVQSPIIIHIRKHYSWLDETFIQCDKEYYEKAIEKIDKLIGEKSIFVFGTEDLNVESFIPKRYLARCELVDKPTNTPDLESLILMSKGKALISANSTFSWWAGKLMINEAKIIVPGTIYKSRPNPKDYYPSNWIQI